MDISSKELEVALDIKASGPQQSFSLITTDTRRIEKGALFVALKGEKQDGHNFIPEAIKKGATGVVSMNAISHATSFQVTNTLNAFRSIAKLWRSKVSYPVVAVCGSAGKTTSKEFLAAILRGRWPNTLKTEASQNGFTGIPTTLLRIRGKEGIAVIEVGIDDIGAMVEHLDIVQPTAGLLTSIGAEHLEKLIDIDTVAREETELFLHLEAKRGIVCVNADDPLILKAGIKLHTPNKHYYTLKETASATDAPTIFGSLVSNSELKVKFSEKISASFPLILEGHHNALNLLGALAMAYSLGLTPEQMLAGLKTFTPPQGRSETHDWNGAKIYADFYNANPLSVEAALTTITDNFPGDKVWLCLGDMRELGTKEIELHRHLAVPIQKHKIKNVLLFGPLMKHLSEALPGSKHFSSQNDLADFLAQQLKPGERALIKGSRSMHMEHVWERLAQQRQSS